MLTSKILDLLQARKSFAQVSPVFLFQRSCCYNNLVATMSSRCTSCRNSKRRSCKYKIGCIATFQWLTSSYLKINPKEGNIILSPYCTDGDKILNSLSFIQFLGYRNVK